jgi:hypothetical protein
METTWYLLPLAASISLVYSASRYELRARIIQRAIRLFITMIVFLVLVYAVLYLLSFRL